MTVAFQSCHEKDVHPRTSLELDDYGTLVDSSLRLNAKIIRRHLATFVEIDKDSAQSDFQTRSYYSARRPYLWIDRRGIDDRADTLLSFLSDVGEMGMNAQKFHLPQLKEDIRRIRTLDFHGAGNDVNRVVARLEYYLTKAFLCYAAGQGFGFVNPRQILNHFDVKEKDSLHVSYHHLFDIPMYHADKAFFEQAFRKVATDSVGSFLREVQPENPFYYRLLELLSNDTLRASERPKILCNMERCRWRLKDQPYYHKKYVFVNIPSFRLYAVDGDSVMSMRVGCGTTKTKTPLLTSRIKRMDVNPQWIIPRSIIEKDVVNHVDDPDYFLRHHYFVRNRKTGKRVDIENITRSTLMDKDYLVIQEGGAGNSLGRIIFRFDNNFSVFLHDTSSPAFFTREERGVSHGCVRVQQPFDLAVFLLHEKDEDVIKKIQYSMRADVSLLGGSHRYREGDHDVLPVDTLDRKKLINTVKVEPEIPVFLSYYTLYADPDGTLHKYSDPYDYDRVIYKSLKKYIE